MKLARTASLAGRIIAVALLFSPGGFGAELKTPKPSPSDAIFADTTVLRIKVKIPPAGLAALRETGRPYRGSLGIDREPRPEALCTVEEGGRTYTNVAVHIKGTGGSLRPIDGDPGLTFNFSKHAAGQTFHGLKKISLNNSVQDWSYLSERICREMFTQIGIPVPRAGFATLELNGLNHGMRVMLEGTDKFFLKRYYKDVSGNLYDGGLIRDFDAQLSVISGDHPEDHKDLDKLRVAMRLSGKAQMTALEKIVDMDRFYNFFAMEVLLASWDSYSRHQNNYRIYHDLDVDRLIFMPQGMDQMFGFQQNNSSRSTPNDSLYPNLEGYLAEASISTPEGNRRYQQALRKMYDAVFDAEKLTSRVNKLANVIRPVIEEGGLRSSAQFDSAVRALNLRISRRCESIRRQLQQIEQR